MIHQIKSLYDSGAGLGKKTIARQLKMSVNTVRFVSKDYALMACDNWSSASPNQSAIVGSTHDTKQ
jgi:DNA-binding NarL/FixJ family response regulator